MGLVFLLLGAARGAARRCCCASTGRRRHRPPRPLPRRPARGRLGADRDPELEPELLAAITIAVRAHVRVAPQAGRAGHAQPPARASLPEPLGRRRADAPEPQLVTRRKVP